MHDPGFTLHGLVRFVHQPGYAVVADFGSVTVRRDRSDLSRPGDDFVIEGPRVQLAARLLYRGPAWQAPNLAAPSGPAGGDSGPGQDEAAPAESIGAEQTLGFVLADAGGAALLLAHAAPEPGLPLLHTLRAESWVGFPPGTPVGDEDRPIASLRPGDRLRSVDGVSVGVHRVDRQLASGLVHEERLAAPIVIAAGAFGPGCPGVDLVLAPGQALRLGAYLVQAAALLGLPGISTQPLPDQPLTYFRVQLDQDACLAIAGLIAEFPRAAGQRPVPEQRPDWQDLPRLYSARQRPPNWRALAGL